MTTSTVDPRGPIWDPEDLSRGSPCNKHLIRDNSPWEEEAANGVGHPDLPTLHLSPGPVESPLPCVLPSPFPSCPHLLDLDLGPLLHVPLLGV